MQEHSYWDFYNDDNVAVGSHELHGIYDWDRRWFEVFFQDENADPLAHGIEMLSYKHIKLIPKARAECELVGVELDDTQRQEPENTFNQLVYQDILKETLKRYPDKIQGFILENHDSALGCTWVG